MESNVATLIFGIVMLIGIIVWLISLRKALRLGTDLQTFQNGSFPSREPGRLYSIVGEETVKGNPEELSKSLVKAFTTQGPFFVSNFRVVEQSRERVLIEKTGPVMMNQPPSFYFNRAEITFQSSGSGETKITYSLNFDRLVRRLRNIALIIILGVGLPVMLAIAVIMLFVVIPNENPRIRWQVFQTLQIVHPLWPPYLVMWFYKLARRRAPALFDSILSSLV